MSNRPRRAAAAAASAYIASALDEDALESSDESSEILPPPRKRRGVSSILRDTFMASHETLGTENLPAEASAPVNIVSLPGDIWAVIATFTAGNTLKELGNTVRLRQLCKATAEVSKYDNNFFWSRIVCLILGENTKEAVQKLVGSHFGGFWFNFIRYVVASRMYLPNSDGNPSRTCFAAPWLAPKNPNVRWFKHSTGVPADFNGLVPSTIVSWQDRVLFISSTSEIVCLELSTSTVVWKFSVDEFLGRAPHHLPPDSNFRQASLELQVHCAQDANPSAPNQIFFPTKRAIALLHKQTICSVSFLDGKLEWMFRPPGKKFTGSPLVLPWVIVVPYRDIEKDENFLVGLCPESGAVLWKQSSPSNFKIIGRPAVNLLESRLVCMVQTDFNTVEFASFDPYSGQFISATKQILKRFEPHSDARFALLPDSRAVYRTTDDDEGVSAIVVSNLSDLSIASPLPDVETPEEITDAPEGMGECAYSEYHESILTSGYWSGGNAFNAAILSFSPVDPSQLTWELNDVDERLQECYRGGAITTKRYHFYGHSFTCPIIDAEGASAWAGSSLTTRSLIVVDRNGAPTVNMKLTDAEGRLIDASELEYNPTVMSAWIVPAIDANGSNWILCATADFIWAAED